MLLSERIRIEVFIPDLPDPSYTDFLTQLQSEFTYTFGGCTVISALGTFLSSNGTILPDKVKILFTDVPLEIQRDRLLVVQYADRVRVAAQAALQNEEAVLISVHTVYHDE